MLIFSKPIEIYSLVRIEVPKNIKQRLSSKKEIEPNKCFVKIFHSLCFIVAEENIGENSRDYGQECRTGKADSCEFPSEYSDLIR